MGQGSRVTTSVTSDSRHPPSCCGSIPQRQDLGVRRGVACPLALIVPGRHDPPPDDGNRSDRDLSGSGGSACLCQSDAHGVVVAERIGGVRGCDRPSMRGRATERKPGGAGRIISGSSCAALFEVGEGGLQLDLVRAELLQVGPESQGRAAH